MAAAVRVTDRGAAAGLQQQRGGTSPKHTVTIYSTEGAPAGPAQSSSS